jgi:hypothetical protein
VQLEAAEPESRPPRRRRPDSLPARPVHGRMLGEPGPSVERKSQRFFRVCSPRRR